MTALPNRAGRGAALLRIPPFPGARVDAFARLPGANDRAATLAECVALIRHKRVGGSFWAPQPPLPHRYLLIRSDRVAPAYDAVIDAHGAPLLWCAAGEQSQADECIVGECDPWHMLGGATALVCAPDDELRLIAHMLAVPTYVIDPHGGPPRRCDGAIDTLVAEAVPVTARFANPFGSDPLSLVGVIDLCGFWRDLIDANRDLAGGVGFAFWKQDSVRPLLWGGGDSSAFFQDAATVQGGKGAVALWRAKASPELIARLERRGTPIVEVEDGFLRSTGLGADCIPPLSITVDRLGPYFDPAQPSELERLLEHKAFDAALLERARAIRTSIVAAGLGKYGHGVEKIDRFDPERRHILVAGQVEDDRSVMTGGCGLSTNQELLERVRASEPDALIIYKPHPDVMAGHRKGMIPDQICRLLADKVVTDRPISALIEMVDDVHVNTSLAGFEALMRHKNVITHGVPFYAGWGLTRDLGPVPARRTRRRSLDELVAATLLLYPRYLDPRSGLPCPAEVVVERLTRPLSDRVGPLVRLRRLQGRMRARLARWSATAWR